jgi:hypothetical protein
VNDQGDILYISGRTGRYLEPAAGKANWNIIAMAREGLRFDLASALQKARMKKSAVTVHGIKVGVGADSRFVDLAVQTIEEPEELKGMMLIVFSDAVAPGDASLAGGKRKGRGRSAGHRDLERDLQRAHEEVQAGREEMQTSQEELKSMNEELQSSNEELQSTNEELTTSKEEMQSLNEELQTVNAELQSKLDELSGANNDMKNLLNSTGHSHRVPGQRHARAAVHPAGADDHQVDPERCGPADDRPCLRPALPGAGGGCAGGAADPRLFREIDRNQRQALVQRAHHAVPHHGTTGLTA